MNDLISRQAEIEAVLCGITYAKAINKDTGEVMELFKQGNEELTKAVERIKELPSVQERKGRWVELYDSNYKCSECGAWWHSDDMDINEEFRFCPSCGASMMKGAEDDPEEN